MELDRTRFPALSRRRFMLLSGAAAGLLSAGCGGGHGSTNISNNDSGNGNFDSDNPADFLPTGTPLPTIASPGTRLVPEDGSVAVSPQENGSVVLTGPGVAALNLLPGVVLASLVGDGLVCRVTSVASDGGSGAIIGTAPATLEEAFDSLEIRSSGSLDDAPSRADDTLTGNIPLKLGIPVKDLVLYESGGKSAKASGEVKLGGELHFTLRIQKNQALSAQSLQSLGMLLLYNYSGTFTIKGDVTGKIEKEGEHTINIRELARIADLVRKVPAALKPVLEVKGKFKGNFAAGVAFTATLGGRGRAGFSYDRANLANGSGGFKFHAGTPVFDAPKFTSDSNINPLQSAGFEASFEPVVKLYVAGVAGPYVSANVPSIEASFKRRTDIVPIYKPSGMDVSIKAKLSGEVGIDDAFNILALEPYPLFERELVNFQRGYDDSGKTTLKIK